MDCYPNIIGKDFCHLQWDKNAPKNKGPTILGVPFSQANKHSLVRDSFYQEYV